MSFQQPQQQPYAPPPAQRPPKKALHQKPWVWAAIAIIGAPVFLIALLVDKEEPRTAAPARSIVATTTTTLPAEVISSAQAAAGIPPQPDPITWDAYIAALTEIDPDIVHGKEEKAVDRGRNECSSIRDHPGDRVRQVELARQRFSSPNHPDGFGAAVASRILDVVHQYLCPTY